MWINGVDCSNVLFTCFSTELWSDTFISKSGPRPIFTFKYIFLNLFYLSEIKQLGVRKKILDEIHSTHIKPWEQSSVGPPIQYSKSIKCADAIGMITNINKHCIYITSSIGYITDQIAAHPEILRSAQEGSSVDDLIKHTRESLIDVQNLHRELRKLQLQVAELSSIENFNPPDFIKDVDLKKPLIYGSLKYALIAVSGISFTLLLFKAKGLLKI